MSFTIATLRSDLDEMLGAAVDAETWNEALKEEAIRQALRTYNLQGPAYETNLVVQVSGHEQSLSAITDMLTIECVAWPWRDGVRMEECAVRWRRVGNDVIRMDRRAPQAGEILRVRYRRAHAVAGLDGALETTVPDKHRSLLTTGAASAAATLRLRQISENPAVPSTAARELRLLRDDWEYWFTELLERLNGPVQSPVWVQAEC